ncbi:MAG: ABC transporter permease subunit [Verrucomicrobiales bacterium]|nr:ABC transporter permease subunit [Verrucomicrobiales bacterium]
MLKSPRALGWWLLAYTGLAAGLRAFELSVPVLKIPFLGGAVLGWVILFLLAVGGTILLVQGRSTWNLSPLTVKQIRRFRAIRRGHVSFVILMILIGITALDNLLVGKQALVVRHEGSWYFPFVTAPIPASTFGQEGMGEADYRALKERWREEKSPSWLLLPFIPYAPKLDTPAVIKTLVQREGKVYSADGETPFNGRAYTTFQEKPDQNRQEWTFREGVKQGEMRGWNLEGDQVERDTFEKGQSKAYVDYSEGKAAALKDASDGVLRTIVYPPAPPSWSDRHFLGTTAAGADVLAVLFGGGQQVVIGSILFVTFVFVVGVALGGALGYFGGWFDLLGQRLIEIWSVLPFLFVVMIVSSIIQPNLLTLVVILAAFSWMGTTIYLRTAAYREKARDYVAAARLLGTGTGRIIFHHILPNSIAILVTLAPFEVAGLIFSLAALDFINFGLPPEDPSWGRLLREGTENFNYPWIVTSGFAALVGVLILVTFVGEAVREAFDPKKFTTYE